MRRRFSGACPAPRLEDVAGAKHWDNMPDQGFTVQRPKLFEDGKIKTEVQLYHRKARFEELGYPCAGRVWISSPRNGSTNRWIAN